MVGDRLQPAFSVRRSTSEQPSDRRVTRPFHSTPGWPRNPRKTLPTAPTLVVPLPPTPACGVHPQQSSIH